MAIGGQIVQADENDDSLGLQIEYILLEAEEQPAADISADPAVGDLLAGEGLGQFLPVAGERIAGEDDRPLVLIAHAPEVGAVVIHPAELADDPLPRPVSVVLGVRRLLSKGNADISHREKHQQRVFERAVH